MMELEDLSSMPFGAHKGKPMQDVPASYLHWFWTKGMGSQITKQRDASGAVARYIEKNMDHLKKEHTDGIWT